MREIVGSRDFHEGSAEASRTVDFLLSLAPQGNPCDFALNASKRVDGAERQLRAVIARGSGRARVGEPSQPRLLLASRLCFLFSLHPTMASTQQITPIVRPPSLVRSPSPHVGLRPKRPAFRVSGGTLPLWLARSPSCAAPRLKRQELTSRSDMCTCRRCKRLLASAQAMSEDRVSPLFRSRRGQSERQKGACPRADQRRGSSARERTTAA